MKATAVAAALVALTVLVRATASYPGAVKSFTTKTDGPGQTIFAAHINDLQDEVVAIENGLINGLGHVLKPLSNAAYDLGSTSLRWNNLFLAGNVTRTGTTDGQIPIGRTSDGQLVFATLTAGTGISVTNGGGSVTVAATQPQQFSLIYANAGTSTAAGATTVDSTAISGLTVKDTLVVELALEMSGGAESGNINIVSTTDTNLQLCRVTDAINAADQAFGTCKIYNRQSATTATAGIGVTYDIAGGSKYFGVVSTTTTPWTGSWTIGLRYASLTAGTFQYRWSIYKLAGQ